MAGVYAQQTMSGVAGLLLLITCLGHVLTTAACPTGCHCFPKGDGMLVTCDRRNFTEVPTSIPSNTEELILMHNNIPRLTREQFTGLTMLKTLLMTNCGIEHIDANAFSELTSLLSLDISHNSIEELQSRTFSGLTKLKTLTIGNTGVGAIRDNAFVGLNLTDLSMENNQDLLQISSRAFYSCKVENLYIYGANIDSESIMALRPLSSSLKELHLDQNQKALDIPEEVFQGFTFRKLKLTYNGIRDPLFLMFTKVADLSLEGNRLGPIDFSKYQNLRNLRDLRLGNTGFSEVKVSYFSELQSLRNLYLGSNEITYIPEKLMDNFPQLQRLFLEGNPLHCNCEMLWLRTWLTESPGVVNGARCQTPQPGDLLDIEEDEYRCTPPELIDVTRTLNVSETSAVDLNCIATGDPAPAVIWELPTGLREETPPPSNKSLNLNKGVHRIRRAVMAQAGMYRCLAYNPVGNDTATVKVDVYREAKHADSASPRSVVVPPLTLAICALAFLLPNVCSL